MEIHTQIRQNVFYLISTPGIPYNAINSVRYPVLKFCSFNTDPRTLVTSQSINGFNERILRTHV